MNMEHHTNKRPIFALCMEYNPDKWQAYYTDTSPPSEWFVYVPTEAQLVKARKEALQ
jgi:hypothetical protein